MCYYEELAEKGAILVKDLVNENGQFLTLQELNTKYSTNIPWLKYYSLISAIPSKWLNTNEQETPSLYNVIKQKTKIVKYIYDLLNKNNEEGLDKAVRKLAKICLVSKDDVKRAYLNIHKFTNITKYRDFQHRLLSNAIFTNERLFYWKKVLSKGCEFCNCELQTV